MTFYLKKFEIIEKRCKSNRQINIKKKKIGKPNLQTVGLDHCL